MKTIKDFIEMFPDDQKRLIYFNMADQHKELKLNSEATSIAHALTLSFHWASSPQGDDYWRAIYDRLEKVKDNVHRKRFTEENYIIL